MIHKIIPAGDTAITVELGGKIDRLISGAVLALSERITQERISGVTECVPTFRSLMIHYDPLTTSFSAISDAITDLLQSIEVGRQSGCRWNLPACYHEPFAPDLQEVATRTGLSNTEVIQQHCGVEYHVYMLGFLPGFAYLGDLAPALVLPRRTTPRVNIPPGSIAIATTMTAVYPLESPGGWHLIGRTPVPLWQKPPGSGALLNPGDRVTFTPISVEEYRELEERISKGEQWASHFESAAEERR